MNLKLLKAFVTLAEKGNYAEAASALSMTQPALTKQINLLESAINLRLFNRGRQGTLLTPGGAQLLPEARKVLKQSALFMQHAGLVAQGLEGKIAIGFGLSSFVYAPQSVARFGKRFPAINITLQDLPSSQQMQMLQQGELQMGFVRVPPPSPLEYLPLFEDRLVLITPESRSLTVDQWLAKHPLLRLQSGRGQGLNGQIDLFMHEQHYQASSEQYAADIHTLLAMVLAGLGVALLPQSIVHIAPSDLNIVQLKGRALRWQTGIAWDPRIEDGVRDKFIEMVRQESPAAG
ncbi:LysR family transcriptional regulator [Ewingella americana]|uniref:LysR family transcriptional regulator n=2 Tax=Ewingella americana TaxID=41202 RepID=A0A085GD97_EWIA3|nr:LysR family transcriptional regulator [Ewingella americana]KAA8729764.1 LysR family transcriptional regulator [Ewingella americana]KFC81692.1 LysR family transcriptional regulator [Ewingella americana ATCC 33852]STQ44660.1 Hca operon transcriptional activator [Ewingella americana]